MCYQSSTQSRSLFLNKDEPMNLLTKTLAVVGTTIAMSATAMAADALSGTTWTTYDDATGAAKAVVRITDNGGRLSGTIIQVLDPKAVNGCTTCTGKYKNKSLVGATVFSGLKNTGGNSYDGGTITDPKNGKSYSLAATRSGGTLQMRGYMGVKALGRTQTWRQR